MGARNGGEYLSGLAARPREVWLDGQRVENVAEHPAFRAITQRIAELYDLQHDPEHSADLLYESPTSGERVPVAFMIPRTPEDLRHRHRAFAAFAEATLGMIGRSQDFLNTTVMAFADSSEVFARGGRRFAENVLAYYEHVRESDLFLTHALVSPQIDRSRSSSEQRERFLHLGVVEEDAEGIVVQGARMLATLAPMADEIIIYNLPGVRPGDEDHALAFALPLQTPGLRLICRQPYERGESSSFDHPLAANLEESDALVVFDDVRVPWERVFIYRDVALANALYIDTNLRQHTAHQTSIRALAKTKLVVGIAIELAQSIKVDGFLHVQQMLGEGVGYLQLIESAILRAEAEFETSSRNTVRCRLEPLQTLRGYLTTVYPRVVEILQIIGAGGLMIVPSQADFEGGAAADVERYFQGSGSVSAVERARIFKIAADLTMSAFGARQVQYERYYAGDPLRLLAGNYLAYDKSECQSLVSRACALAGDPSPVISAPPAAASGA